MSAASVKAWETGAGRRGLDAATVGAGAGAGRRRPRAARAGRCGGPAAPAGIARLDADEAAQRLGLERSVVKLVEAGDELPQPQTDGEGTGVTAAGTGGCGATDGVTGRTLAGHPPPVVSFQPPTAYGEHTMVLQHLRTKAAGHQSPGGTGSFTTVADSSAGPIDGSVSHLAMRRSRTTCAAGSGDNRVRSTSATCGMRRRCEEVMDGVDYVFHAAALKQVPVVQFFPLQAVATNVQGSDNVIRAAHDCGVKSVVCLSTDKAVYRSMRWAPARP